MRLFIAQLILLVMLSGCMSTSHFQAWSGPQEFEGQGGAFTTKNGIDIYTAGSPNKKCRVLGVINSKTISSAGLMAVFGNSWSVDPLVNEAKKRGGDAIILTDAKNQLWLSSGHDAYGNTQIHTDESRDCVAILVQYVGDVQRQNASADSQTTDQAPFDVNAETAAEWKAKAEKGDPGGEFCLACCYLYGQRVPKDYAKAVEWFRKSANQGFSPAQHSLGACYAKGEGVPQNDLEAYFWFNLAATGGNKQSARSRDLEASHLSRDEVSEAQRRAAAFVPQPASLVPQVP